MMTGLTLYMCALAYVPVDISNFPLINAAAASSLVIGLLAVFAPAGIGVTEGISTAILSQIMPLNTAITVAFTLRLVRVLADFSCAFISACSVAREEKVAGITQMDNS
jgi:uncharacterized membrane protein YbhN (UPF0104 family)